MKRSYQLRIWVGGYPEIHSFAIPLKRYMFADSAHTDGLKVEVRDAPTEKWRAWKAS